MWRWRLMVSPLEGIWGRGDWLRSDWSDNTVAGLIRHCNTTAWLVRLWADGIWTRGRELRNRYWNTNCVAKLPNYMIHVLRSYRATLLTVLMCCQATDLRYWQYLHVAKLQNYVTGSTYVLPSYRSTLLTVLMCCQATELRYWQYLCLLS